MRNQDVEASRARVALDGVRSDSAHASLARHLRLRRARGVAGARRHGPRGMLLSLRAGRSAPMSECPRCGASLPSVGPAEGLTGGLAGSATALLGLLETAVMMAQHDLSHSPLSSLAAVARSAAEVIGSHGDDLQFGGKHCRPAFAALARGLAALSFCPGGVRFMGAHWCARHPESTSRDGQYRGAA